MPDVRNTSRRPQRRRNTASFAVAWHAALLLIVLGAGAGLVQARLVWPGVEAVGLAAIAMAALFGALLSLLDRVGQAIALVIWALAAAVAAHVTGGLAGPLAAWCLAPMAAAAAFRSPQFLALGAAAAIGSAALTALGGALLPLPQAQPQAAGWLALLSFATVALGTASALIALQSAQMREARQQAEVEMELREVLDHQPFLLMMLYPSGRVLNAFGAPIAGAPAWRLKGGRLADLVAVDQRAELEEALQSAVRDGESRLFFAPAHDPSAWLELSLRRLAPNRVGAALRDARSQRDRELELDSARRVAEQQNAGKSRFLANMSHELRTPLNAIMGFSDIMRQRLFGPMADRYAEYAELIHESGSHLLELINDVLDMSKIEAERFELVREVFDVREAVSAVLRLMRGQAERAGVVLRGVLPLDELEADADRRAVKQITLNLISNALKFTPRGGSVTVTAQANGDVLELIVSDTGMGIAPVDLERLGQPFEQAGDAAQKAAGSGLGLSLVRAFAALHGGEMTIESAVGEGTTVTVRLPVLDIPRIVTPAATANEA